MSEWAKWQLVGVAVAAALAVFAVVRLWEGATRPEAVPVRVEGQARVGPEAGGGGPGLVVHVAGAVRRPGVYRVPPGSRAELALRRAGGPAARADLTAVNLAAPLEDGQQLIVPLRVRAGAAGAGAGADAPLSLATATADQLEELDGIGETIAERIVEHRDSAGGLRSLDDLAEVDGIGEKRLEALKEALRP